MPPSSVQTRSLSYFGSVWYRFFRCFSSVFSIFLSFSKVFLESIFTREALDERIHFFTTEMKRKKNYSSHSSNLSNKTVCQKHYQTGLSCSSRRVSLRPTKQALPSAAAASVYGVGLLLASAVKPKTRPDRPILAFGCLAGLHTRSSSRRTGTAVEEPRTPRRRKQHGRRRRSSLSQSSAALPPKHPSSAKPASRSASHASPPAVHGRIRLSPARPRSEPPSCFACREVQLPLCSDSAIPRCCGGRWRRSGGRCCRLGRV
jgi:hypothetical protein